MLCDALMDKEFRILYTAGVKRFRTDSNGTEFGPSGSKLYFKLFEF
jgi:hypothetical protein